MALGFPFGPPPCAGALICISGILIPASHLVHLDCFRNCFLAVWQKMFLAGWQDFLAAWQQYRTRTVSPTYFHNVRVERCSGSFQRASTINWSMQFRPPTIQRRMATQQFLPDGKTSAPDGNPTILCRMTIISALRAFRMDPPSC